MREASERARITVIMHTMMVQRKEGGLLAPAKYGQMIMRCRDRARGNGEISAQNLYEVRVDA